MSTSDHTSSTTVGADNDPGDSLGHARDSDGEPPERGSIAQLSELARELQAEPDMASLLQRIVQATVDEIEGAVHGGITLLENGIVRAVAATHPVVERLDQEQNQLGEGPCLSSLTHQITVRSDDFLSERRWPAFVAAAIDQGVRSMLSVQLFVENDNLGALNLYSTSPHAFDDDDEDMAMALASHAAVAMKGSRIESNLQAAIASRDLIGQAKGILMERHKINAHDAFRLLVITSQHSNRKVRAIAEELTATGQLPTQLTRTTP